MRFAFWKKDKRAPRPGRLDAAWPRPSWASAQLLASFPPAVLQRILGFVCPHAGDESYETCETSAYDGCMLCDLRDLSHCAQVSRAWRANAMAVLYHSVRIDPVHYCELEAYLSEKRKKTSRFDCNGIPEDPALARLRLFRRTVREDPTRIGRLVQFLKTPYMIRESCHVELAQTLAVLPNLRYVDLPEGMFADEPTYATLRLEVQARCPNLGKTTFVRGSERSFGQLASGRVWTRLEVLELDRLDVDPVVLRAALASLERLRALKVTQTPSFTDQVMASDDGLPPLPALEEVVLKDAPWMTAAGLVAYLSWPEAQKTLRVLTLQDTGVKPWRLPELLALAPSLRTLAVQTRVSEPFPGAEPPPPLESKRLRTLRFEMTATPEAGPYVTSAYHSYLASSVLSGGLPMLRRLYVLDEAFPDRLSLPPPPNAMFAGGRGRPGSSSSLGSPPSVWLSPPPVGGAAASRLSVSQPPRQPVPGAGTLGSPRRFSSNNPFAQRAAAPRQHGAPPPWQTLEVFTKTGEFGQWNFARVDSMAGGGAGESRRPASSYGLATDVTGLGWDRGAARRSVMVGSGSGGFLAVPSAHGGAGPGSPRGPSENVRPHSTGGAASRGRPGDWGCRV